MPKGFYFGGLGGGSSGPTGPIGATGANATPWTWRGLWTGGVYTPNQTVTLSGQSYICILTVTNTGITDTTYWNKVASTGLQGLQGNSGIVGPTGLQGAAGLQGLSGTQGGTGIQGPAGSIGPSGTAGPTGLQGPVGIQGPSGLAGPSSVSGLFSNLTDVTGIPQDNTFVVYNSGLNRWIPKFTSFPIWDVRDFGASGNSIINNFTGIRAAVVAVNNSGGTLYIPGGTYKVFLDNSNSGIIGQSGLLSLARDNIQILADNDAIIQYISTISSSGALGAIAFPLVSPLANNCRMVGGTFTFEVSGNVLFTGDGNNGFPIYYSNTAGLPYNTSFENCTFSGFKGESIVGGLTNTFGEQLENTYWKNCTFMSWGAAWHDMLLYHQGRNTFDGCLFLQRAEWDKAVTEHSHAIYTGANRPYSMYKNCVHRNIGGGVGNRSHPYHFFGSVVTFASYGIIIDGCNLITCSNPILFSDVHNNAIVSNTIGGWAQTGLRPGLSITDTENLTVYNSELTSSFGANPNKCIIFNNVYDSVFAIANSVGSRNILVSNSSFRSALLRSGLEFSGGVKSSSPNIALYGGNNVLFANNNVQGSNDTWAAIIRNTFDLNGYTFVDNFFNSNGSAVVPRFDFTSSPSRNGNFIGNYFYDTFVPQFLTINFGTGLLFHSNVFNATSATTTGSNSVMYIESAVSGCMLKNNTFMNIRRPPTINSHSVLSIGNYFFKTGNVPNYAGTGILAMDIYNTSGNL